ncbi:Hypothetical Protein FCC1311_101122 [Hondaea fermentalgiana]|uniref:Uncharacterized protein n=1 Tax=Hondaea fermentalgiana TaxID=2315210 RepID=A0A2R5GU90_9STRA|nr:Hypothetical Protein FCC1311_101122 [Hondaea fermentalgiana]|eukprot:GBG33889.1 Hypothetical Protein FCC1311_101122 [Hondaea fermentalgiana]
MSRELVEVQRLEGVDLSVTIAQCQERIFAVLQSSSSIVSTFDFDDVMGEYIHTSDAFSATFDLQAATALACVPSRADIVLVLHDPKEQGDGSALSILRAPIDSSMHWSVDDLQVPANASGSALVTTETPDERVWAFVGFPESLEVFVYEVLFTTNLNGETQGILDLYNVLVSPAAATSMGCLLQAQSSWVAAATSCDAASTGWYFFHFNETQEDWAISGSSESVMYVLEEANGDDVQGELVIDGSANAVVVGVPLALDGDGVLAIFDPVDDVIHDFEVLDGAATLRGQGLVGSLHPQVRGAGQRFAGHLALYAERLLVGSASAPWRLWTFERTDSTLMADWTPVASLTGLGVQDITSVEIGRDSEWIVGAWLPDQGLWTRKVGALVIYTTTATGEDVTHAAQYPKVDFKLAVAISLVSLVVSTLLVYMIWRCKYPRLGRARYAASESGFTGLDKDTVSTWSLSSSQTTISDFESADTDMQSLASDKEGN